jgi:hypothetical protein
MLETLALPDETCPLLEPLPLPEPLLKKEGVTWLLLALPLRLPKPLALPEEPWPLPLPEPWPILEMLTLPEPWPLPEPFLALPEPLPLDWPRPTVLPAALSAPPGPVTNNTLSGSA